MTCYEKTGGGVLEETVPWIRLCRWLLNDHAIQLNSAFSEPLFKRLPDISVALTGYSMLVSPLIDLRCLT
jgi:hypothetical protein